MVAAAPEGRREPRPEGSREGPLVPPPGCDGKMTQAGKKKKRAVNRSIMLAKKIIIKDGGTVRPGARGGLGDGWRRREVLGSVAVREPAPGE